MTGRTHDLAAFTALTATVAYFPLQEMTLATAIVAFTANMLGGLAPDIDQTTSSVWEKFRFGRILSNVISPLFGRHRFISHSVIGIVLFSIGTKFLLGIIGTVLLVDMNIVWLAFMIGFISHLLADMLTRDGIPLLFPLPFKFGIPPIRGLRVKTGGFVEKSIIFPGLVLLNMYIFYMNYEKFLEFFREHIIR